MRLRIADKEYNISWEHLAGPFLLILALVMAFIYQIETRSIDQVSIVENSIQATSQPFPSGTEKEITLVAMSDTPQKKMGEPSQPVPTAVSEPLNLKININTASVDELVSLPAIGEVKAKAIVAYRTQNGPFKNLDQLLEVNGIGPKTLEKLKNDITLSP